MAVTSMVARRDKVFVLIYKLGDAVLNSDSTQQFGTPRSKACAKLAMIIADEYEGKFDFRAYLEAESPDDSAMLWRAVDDIYVDFTAFDRDLHLVASATKGDVHDALHLLVDAVSHAGVNPTDGRELRNCLEEYIESVASFEDAQEIVSMHEAA